VTRPGRVGLAALIALGVLAASSHATAQPPGRIHRVGVVHVSGHHHEVVDGLRQGLAELGLDEGKQFVLDVRETPYDPKAFEAAARDLERGRVDVIYTVTTLVAVAAKRATTQTPIVFFAGSDPVAIGLVESVAKPGGQLTGVHGLSRDLTSKRLALLKEMMPKLARVVTFYNPADPVSRENAQLARDAARHLGVQVVERHVASSDELLVQLRELKSRDADAYFHTPGAMATSQAVQIIDALRTKKLPTMFHEQSLVTKGALASYGSNYYDVGQVSAKHVHRILTGSHPRDLPVENYDKVGVGLNLRVAREIGLTIPPAVQLQADQLIQ
jgi:putative ABC transport system substrate-binding protein